MTGPLNPGTHNSFPAAGKSLTLDPRWDYGVFYRPDETEGWTLPFIGWTTEPATGDTGTHTHIVPVFLADPHAVTPDQYAELMGDGTELRHLVPATTPASRAEWEERAAFTIRDTLIRQWGYSPGDPTPAQMATDAVRALSNAGLTAAPPVTP